MTVCQIATQFPRHGCNDDLTTKNSFGLQAMWVIGLLVLFFDIFSLGICTPRHWQASGRLVQEINVGTVLNHVYTPDGSGLTHLCLRVPPDIVFWIYDTYDNDSGAKN